MHFRKIIPSQFYDTRKLYDVLASLSDLQGKEFIFTGHSLGGSDAVYLGSKTGERTVTFNAYGIKNFLGKDIYTENITNYGNPKDPIFMKELKNQVGKIKYVFTSMNFKSNVKSSYSFHYLENMGDVNMAVDDITGKKFLENVESMTKSNINDDIYNLTDKTYQYLYGDKNFCSGYVTVDDYTRNGIKVEGYTRRCPYHNQTY